MQLLLLRRYNIVTSTRYFIAALQYCNLYEVFYYIFLVSIEFARSASGIAALQYCNLYEVFNYIILVSIEFARSASGIVAEKEVI